MASDEAEANAAELLTEREVCTLATASPDGDPEAPTVRFVADGYTVFVNTATTYRKYENLKSNPNAAVVITRQTADLQLEGTATELTGDEADSVRERYWQKYGPSEYLTDDHSTFFQIEADWARVLVDPDYPPEYEMLVGEGETKYH